MITSVNNPKIKELLKLKTTKGRKNAKRFIVEGPHLVKEAKLASVLEEAYTIDETLEGELLSIDVMKKFSETNTPVKQIGICKMDLKNEIKDKVLILDGIQDPGNLGTILRTAIAFNFETIFLADGTCDLYNEKVIRSSQGAIFKLNFIYGDKIDFIKKLEKTHKVYSTNVVNGIDVKDIKDKDKIALILGNEGNGVSDEINALNLSNIYIKLNNTESLNVAIAGAILMYELNK